MKILVAVWVLVSASTSFGQDYQNYEAKRVRTLVKALSKKLESSRLLAIEEMGQFRSAAPFLLPLLDETSPKVQTMALQSLQKINALSAKDTPRLFKLFKSSDVEVRTAAVKAMTTVAKGKGLEVAPLVDALKDDDTGVRAEVIKLLISMGKQAESAVKHLLEMGYQGGDLETEMLLGEAVCSMSLNPGTLITDFVADLKSNDRKRFAIIALANIPGLPADVIEKVRGRLEDGDPVVRASALKIMGHTKAPDVVKLLAKGVKDAEAVVRVAAMERLGALGKDSRTAMTALLDSLSRPDTTKEAVDAIAKIGWADPDSVATITDRLLDDKTKILVARALGDVGPGAVKAIPRLVETFHNSTEKDFRKTVVIALCKIRPEDPDAGKTILFALQDLDLQNAAEEGFWVMLPARAVALLNDAMKQWDDPERRWRAATTVSALGPDGEGAIPAIVDLVKSAASKEQDLDRLMVESLGVIGTKAIPALTELLKSKDYRVRHGALKTLGAIGSPTAESVQAMVDELRDPEVGDFAAQMAGKVGPMAGPLLVAMLSEKDPFRLRALSAIGYLDEPPAEALLPTLQMLAENDLKLKEFALGALTRHGARAMKGAMPALMKILEQGMFAEALSRVFGSMGPPAVPDLTKVVTTGTVDMRRTAAQALGMIEPETPEAILAVRKALKSDDQQLRALAGRCLANIGPLAKDALEDMKAAQEGLEREWSGMMAEAIQRLEEW